MRLLPMFPLQIVVFPKERVNLHIFEPRYRQLVRECKETGQTFGIPAYIDGKIMQTGTEILLTSIEKTYPDGKMDIKTVGTGLFDIETYHERAPEKLYGAADVSGRTFKMEGDITKNIEILALIRTFFRILQIKRDLPEKTVTGLSFKVGHLIGLNLQQEYTLLRIPSELERQDYIIGHLNHMIPVVRETEELKRKAMMNGQFRHIIPPDV